MTTPNRALLRVEQLRKSFGPVTALDGVDLSIRAGEILCLLGRNGAGKSTFVSVVSGLVVADSGHVLIDGRPARPWDNEIRSFIGVAGQETGVYPPLTVRETLVGFGRLYGLRRKELVARVEEVSDALDLEDLLEVRVQTLSGGQRRRVHTALALINRPRLVLLDEPTAGVDVPTRNRLLQVVRNLAAEGAAVCYSTHYLHEVEALDARVVILERGRVIASGTCRELIAHHGTGFAELTFAGRAPRIEWNGDVVTEPRRGTLRVACSEPHVAVAGLIDQAVRQRCVVHAVEIVRPSLEGVFLALTGERFLTGAVSEN
jgi:ABC-2 type transport system ATP-binding protein